MRNPNSTLLTAADSVQLLWLSWLFPLLIYEGAYRIVGLARAATRAASTNGGTLSPRIDIGSA